jgi:excisionase family DNA binding protein
MPDPEQTTPSPPLPPLEPGDEWMSTDQVAEEWKVNKETVRRWARDGHLPLTRTPSGRQMMFKRSDVIKAFEQGRQVGRPKKPSRDTETIDVPGERTIVLPSS